MSIVYKFKEASIYLIKQKNYIGYSLTIYNQILHKIQLSKTSKIVFYKDFYRYIEPKLKIEFYHKPKTIEYIFSL